MLHRKQHHGAADADESSNNEGVEMGMRMTPGVTPTRYMRAVTDPVSSGSSDDNGSGRTLMALPEGDGKKNECSSPDEFRERYLSMVHHLPPNPTLLDRVLYPFLSLRSWWTRLTDAFGFKFVALLSAIYGLNQGLGEKYMGMSVNYFLKDTLKLEPATAQAFSSIAHLPWNIKPIYGLISDTVPIFGYRRTPYIVFAGAVGTLAWLGLSLAPHLNFNTAVLLVLLVNYSISSPDVMIDGAVTERSQVAPIYASDLQSLSWGSHSLGGLLGALTVGQLQRRFGSKPIFAVTCLTSVVIMVMAACRWLPEKKVPLFERKISCGKAVAGQTRLYMLAFFVALAAVTLAASVSHIKDHLVQGGVTVVAAVIITTVVYVVLRSISPKIARPAVFFFVREALQPGIGEVMFYFYTSAPNGPHFQPDFLGYLDTIGSISALLGIVLYTRYMSSWNYRTIFTAAQMFMVGAGMIDYMLVTRTNLKLGIPDKAFMLGDEALIPVLRRLAAMPFYVLAAKVCPEKCEATLFALLMALSNFGGDVGSYMGVALLRFFDVNRHNYSNLPKVVLIKSVTRLIPILLIPLLIPSASPADEILSQSEKELSADGPAVGSVRKGLSQVGLVGHAEAALEEEEEAMEAQGGETKAAGDTGIVHGSARRPALEMRDIRIRTPQTAEVHQPNADVWSSS